MPEPDRTPPLPELRVGHGYDLHRLEPLAPEGRGRPFVLAGILLPLLEMQKALGGG